jgi:hypothetical protein
VVTLRDSCEVRTESRFHFVVVTLRDSCEVRTESRFHFVVETLCDSCEVRTHLCFSYHMTRTVPVFFLALMKTRDRIIAFTIRPGPLPR